MGRLIATLTGREDLRGSLGGAPTGVAGALPGTIELPEIQESDTSTRWGEWMVVVYDNDTNTYDEVVMVLMMGTGCTAEEAYIEAWEIDHLGKSVVHFASETECLNAAAIIAKIGIRVEVSKEM